MIAAASEGKHQCEDRIIALSPAVLLLQMNKDKTKEKSVLGEDVLEAYKDGFSIL